MLSSTAGLRLPDADSGGRPALPVLTGAMIAAAACAAQAIIVHVGASAGTVDHRAPTGVYGPKGSPGKDLAGAPGERGAAFHYVDGSVAAVADGASVRINQAQPVIGPAYHSLVELAVESPDSRQIVEVGWTVDRALDGDDLPHLFVFHWVDGAPTCYNGCGFVQLSATVHPGEKVTAGTSQAYEIRQSGGDWWVGYGGTLFGYFPDTLWNGTYTEAGLSQVFGEVATDGPRSCTMMGDGVFGAKPGSTAVSQFALINPRVPVPALVPLVTDPLFYNQGKLSDTSFQLGGPGTC